MKLLPFVCNGCLKEKKRNRMHIDGKPYCRTCGKFLLRDKELRDVMRSKELDKSRLRKIINNCEILGTCGILDVHHQILKGDPERLTTEFMIKLICGDDKLKEYKKREISNIPYIPMELLSENVNTK